MASRLVSEVPEASGKMTASSPSDDSDCAFVRQVHPETTSANAAMTPASFVGERRMRASFWLGTAPVRFLERPPETCRKKDADGADFATWRQAAYPTLPGRVFGLS